MGLSHRAPTFSRFCYWFPLKRPKTIAYSPKKNGRLKWTPPPQTRDPNPETVASSFDMSHGADLAQRKAAGDREMRSQCARGP